MACRSAESRSRGNLGSGKMASQPIGAVRAADPAAVLARPGGPRHRFIRCCSSRWSSRSAAFLVHNTLVNLDRQHIATGFGFLHREAAFAIGESLIAYAPADTYARAFLVGLLNTLYVAVLGIVLATLLGTLIGIARLSRNWLIAKLALVYVETFRNIPLPCSCCSGGPFCAPAPRRRARPGSRCRASSSAIAASISRCRSPIRPIPGSCWPLPSASSAALSSAAGPGGGRPGPARNSGPAGPASG